MFENLVPKALAAMPGAPDIKIGKPDNVAITNIGTLVQGAIQGAIIVSALMVFMFLIWGGIQWISSGGDKGKTQEARDRITAALLSLGHHSDHLLLLWHRHLRWQHHPPQGLLREYKNSL